MNEEIVQIGGHEGDFEAFDKDKIMKLASIRELEFYRDLDTKHERVKPFVPSFYGFGKSSEGNTTIILENLTRDFKVPCVMDVKIGISSADPDATGEKLKYMREKDLESTTHSLGLRITGMGVYQVTTKDLIKRGKKWGRSVTTENASESLALFFHNGIRYRTELIQSFIDKIVPLLEFFELQNDSRFFSSSLLFVYDGANEDYHEIRLKMIDFAHVHSICESGGRDDGYIYGLKTLISLLQNIKNKYS